MFNAVYFFSLIGLKNTFTANLIIYCVLLGGVLASFYLVDKVGRRPLLLGGIAFMAVCVFIVGGIGFMTLTDAAGNALVAICSLWVAAYSISVAPIGNDFIPSSTAMRSGAADLRQAGSRWSRSLHPISEYRQPVLQRWSSHASTSSS